MGDLLDLKIKEAARETDVTFIIYKLLSELDTIAIADDEILNFRAGDIYVDIEKILAKVELLRDLELGTVEQLDEVYSIAVGELGRVKKALKRIEQEGGNKNNGRQSRWCSFNGRSNKKRRS